GKANIKAYVEPFEAETGIRVNPITDDMSLAQLELMVTTNNVSVDVVTMGNGTASPAHKKGLLEQIDYSIYKKEELDGIVDFGKEPFGVAFVMYSVNMVYNTDKFPSGKPRPNTWAEFW
ncbi:MAG: extracellular solute-binding protein, partial [Mesorhizobium sp.]